MSARKQLPNGTVMDVRLVNHKDGRKSIKRKVVAVPVPKKPAVSLARVSIADQPINRDGTVRTQRTIARGADWEIKSDPIDLTFPVRTAAASRPRKAAPKPEPQEERGDTKTARRNSRKVKPKLTAEPETTRERMHHDWDGAKSIYVTTTNQVPKILRRAKARTGSHVEQFQKDYEMAGADLRSPDLGAGSGGNGLPLPLSKIQAIDRLKEFQSRNERAFIICEAVLICGSTPSKIAKVAKVPNGVATTWVQNSVDDLANFYSPKKRRPDKKLAAIANWVEEERRRFQL